MAFTMACTNFKKGLKMAFGTLGLSSIITKCLQNSATFGIRRNPYCGGHRTGYLGAAESCSSRLQVRASSNKVHDACTVLVFLYNSCDSLQYDGSRVLLNGF